MTIRSLKAISAACIASIGLCSGIVLPLQAAETILLPMNTGLYVLSPPQCASRKGDDLSLFVDAKRSSIGRKKGPHCTARQIENPAVHRYAIGLSCIDERKEKYNIVMDIELLDNNDMRVNNDLYHYCAPQPRKR